MIHLEQSPALKLNKLGDKLKARVDQGADAAYDGRHQAYHFASQPCFAVDRSEYVQAQGLKRTLMEEYHEVDLADAIRGEEFITEQGACYHIETTEKAQLSTIPSHHAREKLAADLKVLHGVRERTEHTLKQSGYHSVNDLVAHDRFGDGAHRFVELIEKCDTYELLEWLGRRYSRSHQLALSVSGLHAKEQLIFVDIETLGLYATPIILIGMAQSVGPTVTVHQYLLRSVHEEPAALAALLSHINDESAFITFNGRSFDLPYLEQRLAYYGLRGDLQRAHFDMLPLSRRAWRGLSADFKLTTLERLLIGKRKDDVPSALIPDFYDSYMRTQNIGPLIAIVDHNRQDVLALVHVFSKLCEGEQRR
ncbi:MAG: ribonuclease H-like domain-containing protein [Halobacteriota archaeon]